MLKKYIFTMRPKWFYFWHPWSGFFGGILFLAIILFGNFLSEAVGDTEFDETVNGYSGYNYETGENIEITEDPAGGYDVYNYETHEYSEIDESSSGGFTVYSNSDEDSN